MSPGFVNPRTFTTDSEPDSLQANNAFWLYAAEYWGAHLEKVVTLLEDPQLEHIVTEDHSELLRLLYLTLNEEEVLAHWCHNASENVFDICNTAELARLVRSCGNLNSPFLSETVRKWIEACHVSPWDMFIPLARVHAKKAFHGDWVPTPFLRIVAKVQALVNGRESPDLLPAGTIIEAVQFLDLEKTAEGHRKVEVALRVSEHPAETIQYYK